MKRAAASRSDHDHDDHSSSSSDSDNKHSTKKTARFSSQVESRKSKRGIDLEALKRHGYKGGPSVMAVPPPKEPDNEKQQDWSWSKGQETRTKETTEETYADRQKTRAAVLHGEQQLLVAAAEREKKELSFSQKEKRKRDLGQASRGKNYVEEEKRLLRDSGIYSGFDS
ncbi:hypothetical protein ACH5RR_020189 [Cinchona calisaya]|uniref:Uncharacterized protein n=1 Tax=Cinchona calisaya TaxID=153742 RepID=A0ABD2ZH18_9GENT